MRGFDFFDLKVCLNCPDAKERWGNSLKEFTKVSMGNVVRFEALPAIGPHQSFNLSVKAILQHFAASSNDSLLLLEDDVRFIDTRPLIPALLELPPNWDILYLGGNIAQPGFRRPERVSAHLARVYHCWTTHAVAFRKKSLTFILANYPHESEQMFDNWLSNELHRFNAYMITPMIAYQYDGVSGIWNSKVDYTSIFQKSDEILKTI